MGKIGINEQVIEQTVNCIKIMYVTLKIKCYFEKCRENLLKLQDFCKFLQLIWVMVAYKTSMKRREGRVEAETSSNWVKVTG